jgi:DNA-binding NtrC family response regulator
VDEVNFSLSTYLSEIRKWSRLPSPLPTYDPEALSPARRDALERLKRYSQVPGAPLLILGERGTGKTRLVEQLVTTLKGRKKVVTLPCGGLDSALAESLLFGHVKGAFTGAIDERKGLLHEANEGILFLDEVQDLPPSAQRKLVRVLQDRRHLYRPVGSNREESSSAELVCASNQTIQALREKLDADLFDRLSHLVVTIPPLRECGEDLQGDWEKVWLEARQSAELPSTAPWSGKIEDTLANHTLPGNLRDLQRLALLIMAWATEGPDSIPKAIAEWQTLVDVGLPGAGTSGACFGSGTRDERLLWFRRELAKFAYTKHGTWKEAAKALGCDEKTLRSDANGHR